MSGANAEQKKAIETTEGPVLIIAGPGTGKTYTLVERVIHLIRDKNVPPEQILIATFTNKAAKELVTRITNRLSGDKSSINVNEMYVGTFHSICHRIIKEYPEYSRISKNYRMMEDFEQLYLVYRNLHKFKEIKNIRYVMGTFISDWKMAEQVYKLVDNLREEMVDAEKLGSESNPKFPVVRDIMKVYSELLERENAVDFSGLQTECMRILKDNPDVLKELRNKIRYIMVDEYQDTNYIQEQLIFLLGGEHKNICVVGDDDQSLYRFRGATVRNILEFSSKFKPGECRSFKLEVNYRSNKSIIDFYNEWMKNPIGFRWKDDKNVYRLDKTIRPAETNKKTRSPAVIKLTGDDTDIWCCNVCNFIKKLKETGKITNYNQIAFLFRSLAKEPVSALAVYLEREGINVYAPRSKMFFKRREILQALGLLMMMFPQFVEDYKKPPEPVHKGLRPTRVIRQKGTYDYALDEAEKLLQSPENSRLKDFINEYAEKHRTLTGTTDYAYSALLYRLFGYEPFSSILNTDMKSAGAADIRPARNLAMFTKMIVNYEDTAKISVLNGAVNDSGERWIDYSTRRLFRIYLDRQISNGVNEYEDDSEYAPSGCVSFLTIHQSKGMEFPVVFVDSLLDKPFVSRKSDPGSDTLRQIEDEGFFNREPFEPRDDTPYFDFWRLYYTAFSRAQELLVLTLGSSLPSPSFKAVYDKAADYESREFNINEFNFSDVKDVDLKDTYSFTSHILVYEKCSRQYKFFKELSFTPVKENHVLFGMLVHQTIEDIHRAAIRKETALINPEQIERWLYHNYNTLSNRENLYLGEPQIRSALKHVMQYAEAQKDKWDTIRQTEVDVSLVKDKYILEGKIDLISGVGDTVEIVDFKSDGSPKADAERREHYRRQLQLYAHLVKERTGLEVSRMHLYYTGQKKEPTVSFDYEEGDVSETINDISRTVEKIQNKEFGKGCDNRETCRNCDFLAYCENAG